MLTDAHYRHCLARLSGVIARLILARGNWSLVDALQVEADRLADIIARHDDLTEGSIPR